MNVKLTPPCIVTYNGNRYTFLAIDKSNGRCKRFKGKLIAKLQDKNGTILVPYQEISA